MSANRPNRKRVAVIGAGPSGLAAARHFSAPGSPFECQVFEQGDDLGGTWRLSEHIGTDEIGRGVHSSMYKNLRTNLPKEVMCYPDFPFPDYYESYLSAEKVMQYLHDYADHFHLRKHIKFNHCVREVRPLVGVGPDKETMWALTLFNWITKETSNEIFDALMVCNGHFSVPNIPEFENSKSFEGKIMHSHDYREGGPFKGQRVLVVGGSFSGLDITMELAKWTERVTLSHRLKEMHTKFPQTVSCAPDIDFYTKTGVQFKDGTISDFDTVIYCTGYHYRFPFLHKDCKITTDGYGVEPLFKHLINIEHPTMCVLTIGNFISPLQLADLQTRFFYQLLRKTFTLPGKDEMYKELREEQKYRQQELGLSARYAHKVGILQHKYYNDLADTANVKTIDPVVIKLHMEAGRSKMKDLYTFRNRRFKIIDSENYIELEL